MTLASAVLALALSACGTSAQDTSFVVSSDPELRARVSELLPELAELAHMELVRPIRVERRTREQLESYLLYKLDQDLPPEKARNLARAYSLVGLVPDGLDLRALLTSVYQEQVAGFYDPDSTALFVMENMKGDTLDGVLIHELVHAVQDQTANLDSLTAEERGNDRQAAAQSAIEGHATLIMFKYMAAQNGAGPMDFSQFPDLSQFLGPAMLAQYPALAAAPRIIQEALLFPYLEGASFVAALWAATGDDRPPPFGANLPQSTEQILDPPRSFGPEPDPPSELELGPVPGYEILYTDVFGEGELKVLLEQHLGPEAGALATGWDGDRHALLRGTDASEGLVWASVWDSVNERDRFVQGFQPALGALGGPATLQALEFLGRPGALLRVGIPETVAVEIRAGSDG